MSMIDLAFGGIGAAVCTWIYKTAHERMSGRDELVRNAAFIQRQSRNLRTIEELLYGNPDLRCVMVQSADSFYVGFRDKSPSVVSLYLRNPQDLGLFRKCLRLLDRPEDIYNTISGKQTTAADCSHECREFRTHAFRRTETSWYRPSSDRDLSAERIDLAILEQTRVLATSRDRELNLSAACHVAIRRQIGGERQDILVLPTSRLLRKTFITLWNSDDLSRFGTAEELFDRLLQARRQVDPGEDPASTAPVPASLAA